MSRRHAAALVLVTMLLLAPAAACADPSADVERTQATVERVVDGDTLVLRGGARVRLVQIDAPEAGGECHAEASARALARLAPPGARVVLEADPALDGVDRLGRILRYVHAGGVNVNVALVRRGAR